MPTSLEEFAKRKNLSTEHRSGARWLAGSLTREKERRSLVDSSVTSTTSATFTRPCGDFALLLLEPVDLNNKRVRDFELTWKKLCPWLVE